MSRKSRTFALVFVLLAVGLSLYLNFGYMLEPAKPDKETLVAMQRQQTIDNKARAEASRDRSRQKEAADRDQLLAAVLRTDATVKQLLQDSRRQRWTELPPEVRGVYVDHAGRPWITITMGYPGDNRYIADTLKSVEQVVAGTATCIRGPMQQVQLVDSRGCVWLDLGFILAGYDGKKWEFVTPVGTIVPDLTSPVNGGFAKWSVQDSAGNVWFSSWVSRLNQPPLRYFLRRTTDGKWKQYPASEQVDIAHLVESGQTVSLEQGRILILGRSPYIDMALFDGDAWRFQAKLDEKLGRNLRALAPLHNGSIVAQDPISGTLWTYWPEPAWADTPHIRQVITQLNADDAALRDVATAELVHNGSAIIPLAQKALNQPDCPPESRMRLQRVLDLLAKSPNELSALTGVAPEIPERTLPSGLKYRSLFIEGTSGDSLILVARDSLDPTTGKDLGDQYLELTGDGELRTLSLSPSPWEDRAYDGVNNRMTDRIGRIWLPGGCRIQLPGTVEQGLPGTLRFRTIAGPDAQSCIYIDGRHILNESIPANAPLVESIVAAPTSLFHAQGRTLWKWNTRQLPGDLSVVTNGATPATVNCPWKNSVINLAYGFTPGLLVELRAGNGSGPSDDHYAFYDGTRWDTANDLDKLVKRNITFLASHADNQLIDTPFLSFGGTPDRFWFYQTISQSNADGYTIKEAVSFQLYAGQAWHDVGKELGWAKTMQPRMTLVDHGRSLLYIHTADLGQLESMNLVTFENGKLKATLLQQNSGVRRLAPKAIYLADKTWLSGATDQPRVAVLRQGALTELPYDSSPLLGDSSGRGWLFDEQSHTVRVCDRGVWGQIQIAGADKTHAMREDPDGRLWLLHSQGISQLSATRTGDTIAVTEVARYAWDGPRNYFSNPAFDKSGGLWLQANPRGWFRVQLPHPARTPAAPNEAMMPLSRTEQSGCRHNPPL